MEISQMQDLWLRRSRQRVKQMRNGIATALTLYHRGNIQEMLEVLGEAEEWGYRLESTVPPLVETFESEPPEYIKPYLKEYDNA